MFPPWKRKDFLFSGLEYKISDKEKRGVYEALIYTNKNN